MGVTQSLGARIHTMRLEAILNGDFVLVLIDSCAAHNFISPIVVEALDLTMTYSMHMGLCLGDGHRVMTLGICKNILLTLGNLKIIIEAYVLGLGEVNLIL